MMTTARRSAPRVSFGVVKVKAISSRLFSPLKAAKRPSVTATVLSLLIVATVQLSCAVALPSVVPGVAFRIPSFFPGSLSTWTTTRRRSSYESIWDSYASRTRMGAIPKDPAVENFETLRPSISDLAVSTRIEDTLAPCVVLMKALISEYAHLWDVKGGIFSLAQGVAYWRPPPTVSSAVRESLDDPDNALHTYNPDVGLPPLLDALEEKLRRENLLNDVLLMVTAGANQAYKNCVLTLLSEGQRSVIFKPYYFNHVMAIQMARGEESLLLGPCVGDTGIPDVDWLRKELTLDQSGLADNVSKINMVTIVNPCNPTGVTVPKDVMGQIVSLCEEFRVWLVIDNTYEHFDHTLPGNDAECRRFPCYNEEHVINIFSFSKGHSMAGFRVGYLTVSNATAKSRWMFEEMRKVQDTIAICVSRISQVAALGALRAGRQWVYDKVKTLSSGRENLREALSPLKTVIGGSGAMYMMAKLPPPHTNDVDVAKYLVEKHGVAVIPGTFCGFPGWIRVCYSNLPPSECARAAARLADGIEAIVADDNAS